MHRQQLLKTLCQRPQQVVGARRIGEAKAGIVEGLADECRTRKFEVDPACPQSVGMLQRQWGCMLASGGAGMAMHIPRVHHGLHAML